MKTNDNEHLSNDQNQNCISAEFYPVRWKSCVGLFANYVNGANWIRHNRECVAISFKFFRIRATAKERRKSDISQIREI